MWRTWLILADTIGQIDDKHAAAAKALRWCVGLIIAVLVGGWLVMWFRAKVLSKDEPEEGVGFGLSELRKLRDRGELTNEEYEAARAKIAGKIKEKAGIAGDEMTLPQIREMLDRGELTAEQYEAARKKITDRLKGRPQEKPKDESGAQ